MKISDFMHMAGETFHIQRDDKLSSVEGIRDHEKREIKFEPDTDVRPGDWLRSEAGNRFYVRETDVYMYNRQPFALLAFYQTEEEHEAAQSSPQADAPTFFNIFGDNYASIIGSPQHAQIIQPTFTFGDLEREIDRRGEDVEALKEMVREIRDTLEHQDSLSRGRLGTWSELMNQHSWITSPIAQLLLVYATTGQIS